MSVVLRLPAASLAILCSVLSLAVSLRAEEQSPAEQLFRSGREAMKQGNYERACEMFEASLELQPTAGTFLNLALSEEQLGRRSDAIEHFRRVVALVDATDDRHVLALESIRTLRAAISSEKLPDAAQSAGAPAVSPPKEPLPVAHPAAASEKTASIETTTQDAIRSKPDDPLLGWGYALVGAGAAAIGVSAVSGIVALSKKNEALAHCSGNYCDAAGLTLADSAHSYAALSTGTLVGGLVFIGAASYIFLRPIPAPAKSVAVGFLVLPSQSQIVISGAL